MAKKNKKHRKTPERSPDPHRLTPGQIRFALNFWAVTSLAMAIFFFYFWIFDHTGLPDESELSQRVGILQSQEFRVTKQSKGTKANAMILQLDSMKKPVRLPIRSYEIPELQKALSVGDPVDLLLETSCLNRNNDRPCRIWGLAFLKDTSHLDDLYRDYSYPAMKEFHIHNNQQSAPMGLLMASTSLIALFVKKRFY